MKPGLNLRKTPVHELPPLTVSWEQAQQPWKDFEAKHAFPLGGIVFSAIDIAEVDTTLEERFFEERIVLTADGVLHVRFAYDYPIEISRIRTPLDLVRWALHLCGKTWMRKEFLEAFIKAVCAIKGWKPTL
jgi:hypothetical protein